LLRVREKGWMNRWNAEDFKVSETALYDTITVHTSHYTFVKTHTLYTTKSEP
jgi:hypothetical protein